MKSPFPGMDPYLEQPGLWSSVHQRLITYAGDALQAQFPDRYVAHIGERVYIEREDGNVIIPDVFVIETGERRSRRARRAAEFDAPVDVVLEDVECREVFLEILDARTDMRVVTVVEILSPTNKVRGEGRRAYRRKQQRVLKSDAHLVEIDLLRGGLRTVSLPRDLLRRYKTPYRVVVSRANARNRRQLYPISLRTRLPRIGIPLAEPDPDAVLDLQAILEEAYEKGPYHQVVDYKQPPPEPDLSSEDAAWVRAVLKKRAR